MRDPLGNLETVTVTDPAIDTDASDLVAFQQSRDLKHLVFHADKTPAVFTVTPPAAAYTFSVLNRDWDGRPQMGEWLAFMACCHSVKLPSGEVLVPKRFEKVAYDMRCADEKSWSQTISNHFGIGVILEIGKVAKDLGNLRPGDEAGFGSPVG